LIRLAALTILATFSLLSSAQVDSGEEQPILPVTLAEMAASADLVALIQVLDTDYEYTRGFPSGGTAFLKVLIPYKVTRSFEDILEVYEQGLHPGECYFENPTVLEEGRRQLVFLKFSNDVEGQYNGLKQGCSLDVLVQDNGQYALRFPVDGILLSDDLTAKAKAMEFHDSYAIIKDEAISPVERNQLLEDGYLFAVDQGFKLTHGIEISEIRKLMGPNGLTLDRSLK